MKLNTYRKVDFTSDINILDDVTLSNQYCGLFRCPLHKVGTVMEDFTPFMIESMDMLKSEGHNPCEWEVDLKIHMLMEGQIPAIPNIHCDNVPRVGGKTRYDLIEEKVRPMYLWVSDEPTTEFICRDWDTKDYTPSSHGDLADYVKLKSKDGLRMQKIPPKTWVKMNQKTPHRATVATKAGWRVFCRLTHNSITPVRPVDSSYIRRHCQVYLDCNKFSW
jgi:hypothetical protein